MSVAIRYAAFRKTLAVRVVTIDDVYSLVTQIGRRPEKELRKIGARVTKPNKGPRDGIQRSGLTQEECARILGCTRGGIYMIEQRALRKLRNKLLFSSNPIAQELREHS